MTMAHYIAVLVPERSGGWTVLFPDLPGCASQGETLDEAIAMAADALAGHLAVARDCDDAIPMPRSADDIRSDREWCSENNVKWDKAMIVPVVVRPPLGRPERVTISMDSNILREIDAYAEKRDLTRSAVLSAGAELLLGQGRPSEELQPKAVTQLAEPPSKPYRRATRPRGRKN
jgi:predicted RNase H-like HicB family nuclease